MKKNQSTVVEETMSKETMGHLAAAEKKVDAARTAAKAAKLAHREARKSSKQARQAYKAARKELKHLKAELRLRPLEPKRSVQTVTRVRTLKKSPPSIEQGNSLAPASNETPVPAAS